jgi:hypothetical protein
MGSPEMRRWHVPGWVSENGWYSRSISTERREYRGVGAPCQQECRDTLGEGGCCGGAKVSHLENFGPAPRAQANER